MADIGPWDIIKDVKGVLNQLIEEKAPQMKKEGDSRYYMIEDNKNPKNDRNVKVTYSQAGNPLSAEEYHNDGSVTTYNTADEFFKTLDRDATDYTIMSAPIDVFTPDKINSLPDEYLAGATTYFDSKTQGQLIPADVFTLENYGVWGLGDRRHYGIPYTDSEGVSTKYNPGYPTYTQRYLEALRNRAADNGALWGGEYYDDRSQRA